MRDIDELIFEVVRLCTILAALVVVSIAMEELVHVYT